MHPLELDGWGDFAVASAGAGAALAGLIIVAMSVNIKEIIAGEGLPARAAATISSVVVILVASIALLVPGQPATALGVELAVFAVVGLVFQVNAARLMLTLRVGAALPWRVAQSAAGVLQMLVVLVGALFVTAGSATGLYLVAVGFVLIFVIALVNAWVLMVEILR
jgi:modulator of FtsH protease